MGIFKLNGIDYMGGGGGGNTNYEELTQLEYDALTEEEKNNGTIYFITDTDAIQPDKFRPVIYSEDEREIGVWVDGKPLYQKTYIVNNISADTEIDLNIPDIEKVINQWGTWDRTNGINNGPWAYDLNAVNETSFATNFIVLCRVKIGPNKLYIGYPSTAAYGTISEIRCTIQYTKTTDFAGSGKWTPQGVPAVHYSTDEQVIGTWIDGKPLYEKVYNNLSITYSTSDDWKDTNIPITSEDTFVEGVCMDENGQCFACNIGTMSSRTKIGIAIAKPISSRTFTTIIIRYTKTTD